MLSPQPGAGRRCGSSSRPSRAGRCGIFPAGLRAGVGVSRAWGVGPPPPRTCNRYSQLLMTPPRGSPLKSNSTSMYLPCEMGLGSGQGDSVEGSSSTPPPRVHVPIPCCASSPIRVPVALVGSGPPGCGSTAPVPRSLTNREELSLRTVLAFPKAAGGEDEVIAWSGGAVPSPGTGTGCKARALTLQHGVGLQELLLHLVHLLPFAAHGCHVGHHQLAGLCEQGAVGARAVGAGAAPPRPASPSQPGSTRWQPHLYLFCRPRSRQ